VRNTNRAVEPERARTYFFFNLGCPKILVDAERTAAGLESAGWHEADDPSSAELLVVTTCAFIAAAEEESVSQILEIASARERWQTLAVIGCLVSREGDKLERLLPEVDIFLDLSSLDRLPGLLGSAAPGRITLPGRKLFTPPHMAYIKISEGCSNRCSYCLIPSIRGGLVCRTRESLLYEATALAEGGVRELIVVAQDTTAWAEAGTDGYDLYGLLEDLSRIPGIEWIRPMYIHPAHLDAGRLAGVMDSTSVVPYIDMPIQHVSGRVLGSMGRGYRKDDLYRKIETLREKVEGIVIRTTVMVGYPGESEEEFGELVEFIEDVMFDHVGIFTWSAERGTAAARLGGRVTEEVAARRMDEISSIQMDVSQEILTEMTGRTLDVIIDRHLGQGEAPAEGIWGEGRWYGQAPDVDGVTYLSGRRSLPGSIVRVGVDWASAYDLFASTDRDFN
jgi:ribosomal protein S12 methylthiotransferase RimO